MFAPATPLTLGSSSAAAVMTISTATTQGAIRPPTSRSIYYGFFLLLPGIVIVWSRIGPSSVKRGRHVLGFLMLLSLTFCLLSCGGVSNGGGSGTGIQPRTYQITVTGASAGTPADPGQSAVVTLVVN